MVPPLTKLKNHVIFSPTQRAGPDYCNIVIMILITLCSPRWKLLPRTARRPLPPLPLHSLVERRPAPSPQPTIAITYVRRMYTGWKPVLPAEIPLRQPAAGATSPLQLQADLPGLWPHRLRADGRRPEPQLRPPCRRPALLQGRCP